MSANWTNDFAPKAFSLMVSGSAMQQKTISHFSTSSAGLEATSTLPSSNFRFFLFQTETLWLAAISFSATR